MTPNALFKSLNNPSRLFLFSGPCVIETEAFCLKIAKSLKRTCAALGITYVFKASFDKANRTSSKTRRGPGLENGLRILRSVRDKVGIPVLTDVHTEQQNNGTKRASQRTRNSSQRPIRGQMSLSQDRHSTPQPSATIPLPALPHRNSHFDRREPGTGFLDCCATQPLGLPEFR